MFFGSTPNFSAVAFALSGEPLTRAVSLASLQSLNAGMIWPSPSWPRPITAKPIFLPDCWAAVTASSCACARTERAKAADATPAAVVWRKLRRVNGGRGDWDIRFLLVLSAQGFTPRGGRMVVGGAPGTGHSVGAGRSFRRRLRLLR